jgi:SAM-dependent methyltransferase
LARELKNVLINRIVERELRRVAPAASGRLIDIGCGDKPYQPMFAPYVEEHVGVDHEETIHGIEHADLVGTVYDVPAEDGSFDTVLCTSVLEHVEEPGEALREARRLLRPGGVAVYTVPFIWHIHEEPRDFYRYSKYGLRYLFDRAGFEVEELVPLSGFWVTFGQAFVYYIHGFARGPVLRPPIVAIGLAVQGCAYLLERVNRAEKWTWMYLVVARARPDTADNGVRPRAGARSAPAGDTR